MGEEKALSWRGEIFFILKKRFEKLITMKTKLN